MGDRFYDDLLTALSSCGRHDFDNHSDGQEPEGDYEDEEVNEGKSDELACPFCTDDFDVLGLCCHIDADHRLEVKPGICPVCASKVTINMASHVIVQHENVLKALCNKKQGSGRSRTAVFLLRKELQEKHLCFIKESPCVVPSSEPAADSMLLSFVNNSHTDYRPQTAHAGSSTETSLLAKESSDNDSSERIQPSDRNDGRVSCDFIQGLVLSTILDDL
ncbi:protein DEHYDRATION-INDUCED 19 homolog 7-like [Primulina huaijiensis]|uniref:protein DEHYDRATION-INDUCED 19 homolog 7-like n=1 Tax=Primulina huaijiensis TaxID=1492673 RepID=UPI003CC76F6A